MQKTYSHRSSSGTSASAIGRKVILGSSAIFQVQILTEMTLWQAHKLPNK